ncbi:MAG: hypothetical protein ACJAUE_002008 [Alcanivorax sp.]|jgi:hypothetical protein
MGLGPLAIDLPYGESLFALVGGGDITPDFSGVQ